MEKDAATKPKQTKGKKYMLVHFGRMDILGLFEHNETRIPKVPACVVVKTDRGLELGRLVGQLGPYKAGQFKLDSDEIEKYFHASDIDFSAEPVGKFIRYATDEDIREERHLRKIANEEIECCRRFVKETLLPMKIVDVDHIFGGERIIFYFMSETRVDFRELVKKLAREYQTRIEMRQIGSRDEAKLLGDYESCGQPCCCQRFLKALKPVNMRMAKMQKATLDPSKISGYCGRLKCCLLYEDKTYTELKKRLPPKNAKVKTEYGLGKVVDTQILTQLVVVEYDDGRRVAFGLEELEVVALPPAEEEKQDDTSDNQRLESMPDDKEQNSQENKNQAGENKEHQP
jgi:cell fate regulator YaaT (PSP1 superfamily)